MGAIIGIVIFVATIWVIYDVWAVNRKLTDTEKLVWTLAALVFSAITALIYFLTQKKSR